MHCNKQQFPTQTGQNNQDIYLSHIIRSSGPRWVLSEPLVIMGPGFSQFPALANLQVTMKHVPSWAQMVTRWPQLFLGCISRNRISQRKEDGGQGGSIVHSQIRYVMSFSRYPFVLRELNLDHVLVLSPMNS